MAAAPPPGVAGGDAAGLSSALLRTRLSATLRNNGTVDALKSQLRAKVLSELRGSGPAAAGGSRQPRPVVEQAANLLIMDYLQGAGYLYTASVFAPESGVPVASSTALPDAEFLQETKRVLDLLHIHPDSRLYRQMTSVRGSSAFRTLLEFVTHSSDQAPGVANSACQTTTDEAHTIERKMEQINERYRGLAHENAMAPLKTLEERLAQCQRDADARIRAEVDEAVTRVRKVEMSKMRLEEQARYSQQLAQVREEMEGTWQKRLEALRQREGEFNEKLSKRENEAEQQLYAHRQRMLSDMEVIRRRDAESRRYAEEAQQHAARQEMRCRELERDLEVKLAQVDKERADIAREREAELSRLRADMLRLRDEEQRELSAQRREVEEQRLQLQISRDSFGDAMAEAKVAREECVELKAETKRLTVQLETLREELQRKVEQCVEREDECRRLEEETRRLQERIAEVEASRRELVGSHLGDSVAGTPHSLRSSRRGAASPAKSQSAKSVGAAGVVDQLEELRASHGRERVLKEKQLIQSQSELKRAGREILSLQQRLSDIQREHDLCQARLKESEHALINCNKELSEVKLHLKMAQQEAEDTRQLLQQSQLALERDRRRAADDEAVKNIFGARASPALGSGSERFESERQLLASVGPLVSGGANSQGSGDRGGFGGAGPSLDGDGAWELELNRIMTTIGELEREDQQLRTQRESLFASQRQERLLRDFPQSRPGLSDRPPVTYAWGAPEEEAQRAQVAQLSAPLVSNVHAGAVVADITDGAAASMPTVPLSLAEEHAAAMAAQRAADDLTLPSALARQHGVQSPAQGAELDGSTQPKLRPAALGELEQTSLLPVRQGPPSPQVHAVGQSEEDAEGRGRERAAAAEAEAERVRRREAQLQEEEKRRASAEAERAAQEEKLRKEKELAEKRKREQQEQEEREAQEARERDEMERQREKDEREKAEREREERAHEEEQRAKREIEEKERLAREEKARTIEAEELRQKEEAEREALEKQRQELQRQEEEDKRREEAMQEQERMRQEEADRKRAEDERKQSEEERKREQERVREQEAAEQARAKEAEDEARAKAREEEELLEQQRRDEEERARQEEEAREERARREREEEQRRREEEEDKKRQQEELERARKQAEEEEERRAQEEREEHTREVRALVQEGTEAIKTGKLEEAQAHYTAAKKASANLASNDEVLTQVEALRSSLEDAQQHRTKDQVLDLIEDARRELGLQGGNKEEVGRMQIVKARDHIKESREKMESLSPGARDELLEEVEELEDDMAAAQDRIAAKEAAEQNKEDEAAKAGDMMDLYRQMMQGGAGAEGGSGSSKGGGGSPDRSTGGSIVEEFEFDDQVSGSGSGGGWGQEDSGGQDAEDDDDVW